MHSLRERFCSFTFRWMLLPLAVSSVMAGCAVHTRTPDSRIRYDFGSRYTQLPIEFGRDDAKPLLAIDKVTGADALSHSLSMRYRLGHGTDQEIHLYRQERWSEAPTALVQQRLMQELGARYSIISAGEAGAIARTLDEVQAPVLRVHLEDFTQVFTGQDTSIGVLRMRVTLRGERSKNRGYEVLGQRLIALQRAASTPDAAGGSRALADATAAAAKDIRQWVDALLGEF